MHASFLTSLKYFVVSAVFLVMIAAGFDRIVIPSMEDQGKIVAAGWRQDNLEYTLLGYGRNRADENNWVWRSLGWPVNESKGSKKRILVLGDSFVWGIGLSNLNDTWWRQLGKELKRRGFEEVEVIGAGLPCKSTREQLEQARKLIPKYKPDLIIWGYVTNDPEERDPETGQNVVKALYELPPDKPFVTLRRNLEEIAPNLSAIMLAIRDKNRTEKLSGRIGQYQYYDWELRLLEGENFKRYRQTVAELGELVRKTGVPSFMITLPVCGPAHFHPWEYEHSKEMDYLIADIRRYYDERYGPVRKLYRENGIDFLDILDDYLKVLSNDERMSSIDSPLKLGANPADGHPGPMLTHFYAVKAADYLESKYRNSLGKKAPPEKARVKTPKVNDWVPVQMWLHKKGENLLAFAWPAEEKALLYMPIRRNHVQLSLEEAVPVKSIRLFGSGLREANIYLTSEAKDAHFDTREIHELGSRRGSDITWTLPDEEWASLVSTIRVTGEVRVDHQLYIELVNDATALSAGSARRM